MKKLILILVTFVTLGLTSCDKDPLNMPEPTQDCGCGLITQSYYSTYQENNVTKDCIIIKILDNCSGEIVTKRVTRPTLGILEEYAMPYLQVGMYTCQGQEIQ